MFYTLARATQIRLRFSQEASPLLIRFLLLTEGKREFHNTCRYDCDILGKFIKTLTVYGENCSTSNTATGRTYIFDIYRYKKLSILTRKYTLTFDLNLCSSSYTACTMYELSTTESRFSNDNKTKFKSRSHLTSV